MPVHSQHHISAQLTGAFALAVVSLAAMTGCENSGDSAATALRGAEYYKNVDELMTGDSAAGAARADKRWVGKKLRVHGYVEAGSIRESIADNKVRRVFALETRGKRILVQHEGPKPDTFRDLAEVVASGTIVERDGQRVLIANELMAKCPSKYEGEPGARPPSSKPNAL